MFTYSIEQWLLFFYIYCFLGWCFESTYVSVRKGHWVNRGFMKAPFLPLYGSGAILMLVVGRIFEDSLILTYLVGLIGATLLELFTGAAMEYLYKIKYWDYSNQRFNFKGHICLTSSIAWGFFTILVTRSIHKPIEALVLRFPEMAVTGAVLVLTVLLIRDFALSFRAAWNLRALLIKLEEAGADMEEVQEKLSELQAELTAHYEVRVSVRLQALDG